MFGAVIVGVVGALVLLGRGAVRPPSIPLEPVVQ
jgi:hypothetical protein